MGVDPDWQPLIKRASGSLFFVFSKVVWTVIRPETLFVIAILLAGALLIGGQGAAAATVLVIASTAFAAVALLPLGDLLLRPLERRFPPAPDVEHASRILVLGGVAVRQTTEADGIPSLDKTGERYAAGAALGKRFSDATLIFVGGSGALFPGVTQEADVAERYFLSAGIEPYRLRIERRSRNTAENAFNAFRLIEPCSPGATILVTSAWHMPRAMSSFASAGWHGLIPWPVDFRSGDFRSRVGWHPRANLKNLNTGVREWIGLFAYRLSGRITKRG